jgi:hypothetical protein
VDRGSIYPLSVLISPLPGLASFAGFSRRSRSGLMNVAAFGGFWDSIWFWIWFSIWTIWTLGTSGRSI